MPGFLNAGGAVGVGGGAAGSSSSSQQSSSSATETEIQSGGDAFGFGELGQITSLRKKREFPEPAAEASSSFIDTLVVRKKRSEAED
jgi:hypothetical protein